jgi:aarF domain-containing kinase
MLIADYKVSLSAVDDGDKVAHEQLLHACHQRSADKLLKLCFDNGGIYIKLGQHIGQLVSTAQHSMQWSWTGLLQ